MLELVIPGEEFYNEKTEEFVDTETTTLRLEHSLLSLSKWESFFGKAFLSQTDKTDAEVLAYVKYMVLDENVSDEIFLRLSPANYAEIRDYIQSPQSATVFRDAPSRGGSRETITSELIYYWMVAMNIPFECQTWHLNRLFALIKICNVKNSKQKKMPRHDVAAKNRELNARRRAELNTSG